MEARSPSPGEFEQNRMLNAMRREYPDRDLTDQKEFNNTWYEYFSQNEAFAVSVGIRDETYKRYLFKEAKGKDLKKDRSIEAKEKVKTPQVYIRRGAQRVDLPGVDTPFHVAATRKGKRTIAKETTVVIRGKKISRLRDKMGRFVKRT